MDVSRDRIHAVRAARGTARVRGLGYLVATLPVAALIATGLSGTRAGVLALLVAATGAAFWLQRAGSLAWEQRQMVDELILHGWTNVEPDAVHERERELCSARVRRSVARALEQYATPVAAPMPVPIGRLRVDPNGRRERLARIAAQIRDGRDIDPRGIVLAARIIADTAGERPGSPHAPQLDEQLARVERLLDGR